MVRAWVRDDGTGLAISDDVHGEGMWRLLGVLRDGGTESEKVAVALEERELAREAVRSFFPDAPSPAPAGGQSIIMPLPSEIQVLAIECKRRELELEDLRRSIRKKAREMSCSFVYKR